MDKVEKDQRRNSLALATRQLIQDATPDVLPIGSTPAVNQNHSGSSWASTNFSSIGVPERPAMPWVGVRHHMPDEEQEVGSTSLGERVSGQCTQAVLLTCLHLSHEMVLREVGQYAWKTPFVKDPMGGMMKIMKRYGRQIQELSPAVDLAVRAAPDPSKASIQANLQKARLAAGLNSYIAVIYSGHGIQEPPTEAGELWCYDKSFEECVQGGGGPSEYIPILLFDVLTWSGSSTCYVWDCQNAGRFLRAAMTETEEIDSQLRAAAATTPSVAELHPAVYAERHIHFAACGPNQTIPRVAGLPDDLFTACMTTPLRMALLYHTAQTFPLTSSESANFQTKSQAYMDAMWENMSDALKKRLSSELEAVLHTIAWQSMEGKDYQKLFGQFGDLISGLAGGFLLSQRVMSTYRANPESIPRIPSSTGHQLWTHWDLILDNFFEQLPAYFDDPAAEGWESKLRLVSFMSDQLDSIITLGSNAPPPATATRYPPVLARLPIICRAALTDHFRERACLALDACLRNLDSKSLSHAVYGGALDVAAKLLEKDDPKIAHHMISIWASLVRQDACVSKLAGPALTADRLTSVRSVKFFLDYLEDHLHSSDIHHIIQPAAVLATVANFVAGRSAPRFVERSLSLGGEMLKHRQGLVHQWGALLIAQVVGSIANAHTVAPDLIENLRRRLLEQIHSRHVESRATAIYALRRWILPGQGTTGANVGRMMVPPARCEGSAMVRQELVRLFERVLQACGRLSTVALLAHLMDAALCIIPGRRVECRDEMIKLRKRMEIADDQKEVMLGLRDIWRVLDTLRDDPYHKVSRVVLAMTNDFAEPLAMVDAKTWADTRRAWLEDEWSDSQVSNLMVLAGGFAREPGQVIAMTLCDEFFERSKLSLHAYLAQEHSRDAILVESIEPEDCREQLWILRHRILEDSLVVAEQQVGLPWEWDMKRISSPDAWTTLTFHSFLELVLACNRSNELLLCDWSTGGKTGAIPLKLPVGTYVKSARFVNELHERIVILAEISNGDIHVLSSPSADPSDFRTISSFLALDLKGRPVPTILDQAHKGLVGTWWRQSGKLCVGGSSSIINVWDCPAERCVRAMSTNAEVPVTTIITEPVSGNIILTGFADGIVKLYDMRQARPDAVLSWAADASGDGAVESGRGILKLGVVLGESRHITSACSNGMLNIHDLRRLTSPATSKLAHAHGMSSASFQAHSGLMSTVSSLHPVSDRSPLSLPSLSLTTPKPSADLGLFRSSTSHLVDVSRERIEFGVQSVDVDMGFAPYTVIHPLRPYLGVGYGRSCLLRGSGVGKGDDTDSGSYSFLKAQARYMRR